MEVVGTLDTLGEDIMRLKFKTEAMPVAGGKSDLGSVSAVRGQEGASGDSRPSGPAVSCSQLLQWRFFERCCKAFSRHLLRNS